MRWEVYLTTAILPRQEGADGFKGQECHSLEEKAVLVLGCCVTRTGTLVSGLIPGPPWSEHVREAVH